MYKWCTYDNAIWTVQCTSNVRCVLAVDQSSPRPRTPLSWGWSSKRGCPCQSWGAAQSPEGTRQWIGCPSRVSQTLWQEKLRTSGPTAERVGMGVGGGRTVNVVLLAKNILRWHNAFTVEPLYNGQSEQRTTLEWRHSLQSQRHGAVYRTTSELRTSLYTGQTAESQWCPLYRGSTVLSILFHFKSLSLHKNSNLSKMSVSKCIYVRRYPMNTLIFFINQHIEH